MLPRHATDGPSLEASLERDGYALLDPAALRRIARVPSDALVSLGSSWDELPPDEHLRDGGRYRHRRHGGFVHEVASAALQPAPHRAHWQPVEYNALHGGLERWFEPLAPGVAASAAFAAVGTSLGACFARLRGADRWYAEAHQFRIDTQGGIGRPTPEGAHRDGVDFVVVLLVARHCLRGGETRVFDAQGPRGFRFTMSDPWSALVMDDARVIHETTPIQPDGAPGHRDTLVLTYRAEGFLSPAGGPS
jgi:hypothetical protein